MKKRGRPATRTEASMDVALSENESIIEDVSQDAGQKARILSRREVIEIAMREAIVENEKLILRKFRMSKYISPGRTKGLFRDKLYGDLKLPDIRDVYSILQKFKSDGFLIHVSRDYWARKM